MCTVSLIPISENDFILTSNRDEAGGRKTLFPEFYQEQTVRVLYPRDAVAGGTWIGVSEKNTLVCLLNGGFEGHKRLSNYRQSRGVVVKDVLVADNLEKCLRNYNYTGIEPFTLVVVNWTEGLRFFELVWDGVEKHFQELPKEPRIWSSSTLYSKEIKEMREEWFGDFIDNEGLSAESILKFHKEGGIGNQDVDLVMDRGTRKTCSVTQVSKNDETVSMRYEDLHKQEKSLTTFEAITV